MTRQERITELAQAVGADIKGLQQAQAATVQPYAPYYVPPGETFVVKANYPLPALIDITIDGFIKTDGFLLEATP